MGLNSLLLFYDVRASQETHLLASTACYEAMYLLFYMQIIFVPYRKHAHGPPRPLIGIAVLFYM
jgi:hypothetical protein